MLRRVFTGLAFAVFLASAAYGEWLASYFAREIPLTPHAPDPARGLIYPFNNHGIIHYFGAHDHLLDAISRNLGFASLAAMVLVGVLFMTTPDE